MLARIRENALDVRQALKRQPDVSGHLRKLFTIPIATAPPALLCHPNGVSNSLILCAGMPAFAPTSAESVDPASFWNGIFRLVATTGLGSECAPVQLLVVVPVPFAAQLAY